MTPQTKTCANCHTEFSSTMPHARYCTARCRYQAKDIKNYRATIRLTCDLCQTSFARSRRYHFKARSGPSHCRSCRHGLAHGWPKTHVHFLTCKRCKSLFAAPHKRGIYCSQSCRDDSKRDQDKNNARRRYVHTEAKSCPRCGVTTDVHGSKCTNCKAEARRQEKRRHRARLAQVQRDAYTTAEIAQRDSYRCRLCNGKVSMGRVAPHPKSPTIDHIIPIAAGGSDTRTNVQLAHFLCNSIKGDRGSGEQLLLVG